MRTSNFAGIFLFRCLIQAGPNYSAIELVQEMHPSPGDKSGQPLTPDTHLRLSAEVKKVQTRILIPPHAVTAWCSVTTQIHARIYLTAYVA